MVTSSENRESLSSGERAELVQALAEQRELLLLTVRGLTDAEAARRTTVSELILGGIVKHLARGERVWAQIMANGDGELPDRMVDLGQYRMADGDTLDGLLAEYAVGTRALERAVAAQPGLDRTVPLPKTLWSPPETVHWSGRRVLLHLIRETAQHAGHADMIREVLDGANTTAQR
ncbi:DinB family protein [Streptomyces sp. NPDC050743]|uniref:DinB family protein n=1 Tax=Streptomyces sp. NPDC050743 TaxID=3365634 RepID=UPI00379FED67